MEIKDESKDTHTNKPDLEPLTNGDLLMLDSYFKNNMNGTQAWQDIHPKAKRESCRAMAAEWLAKLNVKAAVKDRLSSQAMSVDEALARKAAIARGSHKPFIRVGDDGFAYFDLSAPEALENLHLIKQMETKRERRLVGNGEDAETWEGEWVKVVLHDSNSALTDILKMHGKFVDRVDMTSNGETIKPNYTPEEIASKVALLFELAQKRKDASTNPTSQP